MCASSQDKFDGGLLDTFEYHPSPTILERVSTAERAATRADEEVRKSRYAATVNGYLMDLDAVSSARISGEHSTFHEVFGHRIASGFGADTRKVDQAGSKGCLQACAYRNGLEFVLEQVQSDTTIDRSFLAALIKSISQGDHRIEVQPRQASSSLPGYRAPNREELPALMEHLLAFMNEEYSTPLIQTALTHFKFEAYEPYSQGMDYTGRLLSHTLFFRRGLTHYTVLPIGLYAACRPKFHATNLFPYKSSAKFNANDLNDAIERFIDGCALSLMFASSMALRLCSEIQRMEHDWRCALGGTRKGSALELMLEALPDAPIFNAEHFMQRTGRSMTSINAAIRTLLDRGIIEKDGCSNRNRIFEVPRVIDLFDWVEDTAFPAYAPSRDAFIFGSRKIAD